jgi:hypothetical protein
VGEHADRADLVTLEEQLQPVLREVLGEAVPPLHDGDGTLERGVEVEVVELGEPPEPVGVDVHEGRTAHQ